MSGICPVNPGRNRNTYDDTPPEKDAVSLTKPAPVFNNCAEAENVDTTVAPRPGGETITNTVCCPQPGPPGPDGAAGCGRGFNWTDTWTDGTEYNIYDPENNICADDLAKGSDGKIYICILKHTSSPDTKPVTGASWQAHWAEYVAGGAGGSAVVDWTHGDCYSAGQLVNYDGCIFSADDDVCADINNPDTIPDKYLNGGWSWTLVSCTESGSWWEQLLGGSESWLTDIAKWGLNQLLQSALTYFLVEWLISGLDLDNQMNYDGGNVDANYNGDPCVAPSTSPTLQAVVARLCDMRGLDVGDYDVTNLPLTEINMTIAQLTTGRNLIELLSLTHQFGVVDTGGTLKFVPHEPQSAVKTLTRYDDLGYSTSGRTVVPYTVKRLQANELPKEVNLTYRSTANAHEKFVQTATLETLPNGGSVNLEVPFSLSETEAYQIAERILVNSHIGRTTYSFSTSYRNIELEPEDIVSVEGIGDVRILRIDEDATGGILNIVAVNAANNDYNYTASSISPALPPSYTETPKVISASSGLIFESHPFDPIPDNTLRMRIAPHGYGVAGWAGCDIFYSTDGVTYIAAGTTLQEATWGKVETAISGSASYYEKDTTTSITVQLKTGTLASVSEMDVLKGKNNALIGEELIGFETVVDNGGGSYTLTNLRRGMRGTEPHIATHQDKEAFILIDENTVKFDVPSSMMGKMYYFKFVTKGSSLADATAVQYVPNGKSRRPWAVANLKVNRNGNTWNMSWLARNQFDPELQDFKPTPKPGMFGGYALNIVNPGDNTVVRSITQQNSTFDYTEAMQVEDFGAAQPTIKIQIAQIDRVVGLGYKTEDTF